MKGGGECHYPFGTDFGSFVSIGFGVHTGRRDLSEDQYESGLAGAKTGVAQPSPAPEHPATVRELTGIGERAYIVARNPPASDPRDRLLLTANSLVGDLVVRVSTKDPKGLFSTGTADLDGKTVKVLMATVKLVK
jgi:hypothetical protein